MILFMVISRASLNSLATLENTHRGPSLTPTEAPHSLSLSLYVRFFGARIRLAVIYVCEVLGILHT